MSVSGFRDTTLVRPTDFKALPLLFFFVFLFFNVFDVSMFLLRLILFNVLVERPCHRRVVSEA